MCGINERRARGVQFRDKGVAASGRLERSCRWEVIGPCFSHHDNIARSIHGDVETSVKLLAAAQEGGKDQRGAGGVELGHESVAADVGKGRLKRIFCREVGRFGPTRNIGVPSGVYGNPNAWILLAAS